MTPVALLGLLLALCGAGALLAVVLPDRRLPEGVAGVGALASLSLVWLGSAGLASPHTPGLRLWTVPELGTLTLVVDPLSSLFVLLCGLVYLPVSLYSLGYLRHYVGRAGLRRFGVLYHGLCGSVALVLLAGDVLTFLLAWEAMAVLSYLLVVFDDDRDSSIRAGWMMLAVGEAGTLAGALAFFLLAAAARSGEFAAMRHAVATLPEGLRWGVFLLAFFGFGVKAGLVPMSSWLPRAHPAAPGNVSALLSGVIVNLGIYGIVRVVLDIAPPQTLGPGVVALLVGSLSALIGILYATTQTDLKVVLAHSSVEHMGIVTAAIGAGLVFRASGHPVLAAMADLAALYHLGNHALFKALLFLGAGAVDRGAGLRDMDRLGGLVKRMPGTALAVLGGTLSIAALPPLNGFVTEWLVLQTLLRSVVLRETVVKIVFALCGAALALTAALAVTAFVRAYAMSFLGIPRSKEAAQAREVHPTMVGAMVGLSLACLGAGVLPTFIIATLDRVVAPLVHAHVLDALVPPFFAPAAAVPPLPQAFLKEFYALGAQVGRGIVPGRGLVVLHRGGPQNPVVFAMSTSYMVVVLLLFVGVTGAVVRVLARRKVVRAPCWAGGLWRLPPDMTYTATGFSTPVRVVFRAVFHPSAPEEVVDTVGGYWRRAVKRIPHETYVVDRLVSRPLTRGARRVADALATLHHGYINAYVAYVLATLLILLAVGRMP
jgi:hydrogenase-4 component B